ncbi:MAG TPA: hypothetical protein VKG78_12925 [Opitutaceae bacterium]|nr:hypothetical protein [Opitutaceae bacterium]
MARNAHPLGAVAGCSRWTVAGIEEAEFIAGEVKADIEMISYQYLYKKIQKSMRKKLSINFL